MIYHRNVNALINAQAVIPDNNPKGLISSFNCRLPGAIVSARLHLHITHGYLGDVSVNLIAPTGKHISIYNRTGGKKTVLTETYEGDALKALIGLESEGQWQLQAIDHSNRDKGQLVSWRLELELRREVDAGVMFSNDTALVIPNGMKKPVTSSIKVPKSGAGAEYPASRMRFKIDMDREFMTDLEMSVKSPSGQVFPLSKQDGWTKRGHRWRLLSTNIDNLGAQNTAGEWVLSVPSSQVGGQISAWHIEFLHDQDVGKIKNLDGDTVRVLGNAGVKTRSILNAAVPLEVSSMLALRHIAEPVSLAHRLVPTRATA